MNKAKAVKVARQATNIAIKNSEIMQPYVKQKHYRRGLAALNFLYFALKFLDKG